MCDISRCLYDPSLFVEDSKTITNTNTNKAPTPHPRLLAVADLQETSEFAQLDQLVSLREQKQWGNSQEALGAMKRTIAQISHHSSQRDFQPAAPTTPAPILAASAPIEPADAFSEAAPLVRTILRCSSCDTSAHSFPSTPEGDTSPSANKPLRLVIVLFDLWYIEENVCLLELVRCDLNRRHVVEIATNTIVADPELLELMKQVGVAVMYFDELSVEKHQATVAAEGSAQRFIDYIASFDVMLEVRSDESSKEMQDVAYTLHKLRHQLSKHLPVPLLVDFTAAYTATIPGQYKGVVVS